MKNQIVGLGEVVVDWVAIIDHFPEPDEKIDSLSQSTFSGGVTANYNVAASRLGAKSAFIGAGGNDAYYNFLKNDFEKEKVLIDNFKAIREQETPVNFIFVVKKTGEKVIIQSPYMQTTKLQVNDINETMFKDTKLLHSTGIHPDITLKAFKLAKKNDITISFDLEKQIAIRGLENLKPLLDQVDILMPNKAGAMQLTKTGTPMEAANQFLKWGIKIVVVTLGNEGCIAITQDKKYKIPAIKINAVDTTGAGDTFCAAFDYSFNILNFNIDDACVFANVAAGLKIQKLGARTGMPSYKEVKAFIESNNLKISCNL